MSGCLRLVVRLMNKRSLLFLLPQWLKPAVSYRKQHDGRTGCSMTLGSCSHPACQGLLVSSVVTAKITNVNIQVINTAQMYAAPSADK